jgi:type II secretory pathway pseudopilin PulG
MDHSKPEFDPDAPQPLDYANPRHQNTKHRRWLLITFLSLIVAALFSTILIPSLPRSRGTSNRVKSAVNLRQIGQAILLYTNDYQGQYPDSFGTILLNEDITSNVFVSPSRNESPAIGPTTQVIADQLAAGGHISYVYLGRGLSVASATPITIVAYEIPVNSNAGANVLFGDGDVEFEDAGYMSKVISRAAVGQFPVTMPAN